MEIRLQQEQSVFLDALLNGNRAQASEKIRQQLGNGLSIKAIYEEIIKPALYRVGELWEHNQITVAEEHTATSVAEAVMNELYGNIVSRSRIPKKVVLACVENEQHQVGIKMVADIFEMKGWDTYFPGANTPVYELIQYIGKIKPDVIALSASIYFHLPVLEEMIQLIRHDYPETPILVGGQAFRHGGKEIASRHPQITYAENLDDLEAYINQHGLKTPGDHE